MSAQRYHKMRIAAAKTVKEADERLNDYFVWLSNRARIGTPLDSLHRNTGTSKYQPHRSKREKFRRTSAYTLLLSKDEVTPSVRIVVASDIQP